MRYGTPYKGSKNSIAQWIIDTLPKAKNFYDLFAGGCAITHVALLSGKYEHFHANDIGDAPKLFMDAINGKYTDEKRWISREDFARLKDTDAYVRYCWSFGNNGTSYLYAKEVEPWKKALHYARVLNDFSLLHEIGIDTKDASRIWIKAHSKECKEKYIKWYCKTVLKSDYDTEKLRLCLTEKIKENSENLRNYLLEGLKKANKRLCDVDRFLGTNGMAGHYFGRSQWEFPTREVYEKLQGFLYLPQSYNEVYGLQELCESLQSLERLQRLQSLQSLEISQKDYREIEIKENSVIYCFDKDTEILTRRGWVNVGDCTLDDYCLSREPNTNVLQWVKVVNLISYHYKGLMYSYTGKNVDLCVTPNHRMFVHKSHNRKKVYKDEFVQAIDLFQAPTTSSFISAGGVWSVDDTEKITICGDTFDKAQFAYLLGVFLADGSVNNQGAITISQTKPAVVDKIKSALDSLRIKYSIYDINRNANAKCFYICRKYLPYFKRFYLKEKRSIPCDVKNWGKAYLEKLLSGLIDGDGDGERRRIITGSKTLVNDIQEICYKIGLSSSYTIKQPKDSFLKSEKRVIHGKKQYYIVSINHKPFLNVRKENQKMIEYDDTVNCVTLEKWHTVLVRRNGKCIWCGQCDIPYRNTSGYGVNFDHEAFYDWCEKQKELVVISEYGCPKDRFVKVATREKQQLMNGQGSGQVVEEGLYIPKHQLQLWERLTAEKKLVEKTEIGNQLLFDFMA